MGRKINAAIFGSTFLIPGIAGAFGLGDIILNSALNQPLDAKIVITQVGDLSPSEIISKLASAEAFEKSGVTRDQFLNEIRFQVEVANNGNAIIHLSTRKPVAEPFLDFIVEVQWPQGKLLREYTLLLDPPVFAKESYQPLEHTPALMPVRPNPNNVNRVPDQRNQNAMPVTAYTAKMPSPMASAPTASSANTYGPIARSESLWEIAEKIRPSNAVTVHQTMLALQEMNPQAFAQNNINLLKEGAVLRVPKVDEVQQKSNRAAIEAVDQQNKAWKQSHAKSSGADENETSVESQLSDSVDPLPEKNVDDGGHLKLVAPVEENASSTVGMGSSEVKTNTNKRRVDSAVATLEKENLDKTILENEELKSRLTDVSAQVKTSEDLVKLKDEQIASLQQKLNELEKKVQTQPVQVAENATSTDNWLNNPAIMAGMAAAIVAALVGLMLVRRRNKEVDENNELDAPIYASHSNDNSSVETKKQSEATVTDNEFESLDTNTVHEDKVKQELGDVIGEAEIYIAYGRFGHAAELLKQGCSAEPNRSDIRLKYLEVLAEMDDKNEFGRQESLLRKTADSNTLDTMRALHLKLFGTEASFDEGYNSNNTEPEFSELKSEQQFVQDKLIDHDGSSDHESTFSAIDSASDDHEYNFNDNDETESFLSGIDNAKLEGGFEPASEYAPVEAEFGSIELELSNPENTEQSHQSGLVHTDHDSAYLDEASKGSNNDGEFVFDLGFEEDSTSSNVASEADMHESSGYVSKNEHGQSEEILTSLGDKNIESTLADNEFELDFSLDDESDTEEVEINNSIDTMDALENATATNEINLDEDDLDLLADLDETATKLDLARAYLEMGDAAGARDILNEVISEGNELQKQDAKELLKQIA